MILRSAKDRERAKNEQAGFKTTVTPGGHMPPVSPLQTGGWTVPGIPNPAQALEQGQRRASMMALAKRMPPQGGRTGPFQAPPQQSTPFQAPVQSRTPFQAPAQGGGDLFKQPAQSGVDLFKRPAQGGTDLFKRGGF